MKRVYRRGWWMIALLLLAGVAWASTEAAKELNTQGFRLYKQKKYGEAVDMFRRSIEEDPEYALPHYNLACTLCLLRDQGKVCEYDAYRSDIIEHLVRSIELDPGRKVRMKSDADLKCIHDTFAWQTLNGLSPEKTGDVKKVLVAVKTWYGPSPGAMGAVSKMRFKKDGTVEMDLLDPEEARYQPVEGTFTVAGARVSVTFGDRTFTGSLSKEGILTLGGLPGPLTDSPDDCSA